MEKLRVALVGFGGMGRIYAQMIHYGMVKNMTLAGVCCRGAEGQKVLTEHNSPVWRFIRTARPWRPIKEIMTR